MASYLGDGAPLDPVRRSRRLPLLAALIALLAVAALLLAYRGSDGGRRSTGLQVTTPAQTPSAAATPSDAAPVAPSTPAATGPAEALPSAEAFTADQSPAKAPAPVRAAAKPSPSCSPGDCPDGKPGWSGGFSSCRDATSADLPAGRATTTVVPGVTATFGLAHSSVAGGKRLAGTVLVRNNRSDIVSMTVGQPTETEARVYGVRGGAIQGTDVSVQANVTLDPGQTWSFDLGVLAASCGDTSSDPYRALPAGGYQAAQVFSFSNARVEPAASGSPSPSPSPSDAALFPAGSASSSPSASPASSDGAVPSHGEFAVRTSFRVT